MHLVNGHINLYFSLASKDHNYVVAGATADHPKGKFKFFDGYILTSEWGTIDVSVTYDNATGEAYLLWKSDGDMPTNEINTPLYIAKLNEDGTNITSEPIKLLDHNLDWEYPLIEGPYVIFHNGYYYMFYSGADYYTEKYAAGVARATSVTGPYTKAPVPVMSQFTDGAPSQCFVGPGHNSVAQIPGTDIFYMVYHSWKSGYLNTSPGRVTLIDRIFFDEDDWPVVGASGTPTCSELPAPMTEAARDLKMDLRLPADNRNVVIKSSTSNLCWSSTGALTEACSDYFTVRPGNVGPRTISLESVAQPGYFWRHKNCILYLEKDDGSDLFKFDSSFMPVPGLHNASMTTLRPSNLLRWEVAYDGAALKIIQWDTTMMGDKSTDWEIIYQA